MIKTFFKNIARKILNEELQKTNSNFLECQKILKDCQEKIESYEKYSLEEATLHNAGVFIPRWDGKIPNEKRDKLKKFCYEIYDTESFKLLIDHHLQGHAHRLIGTKESSGDVINGARTVSDEFLRGMINALAVLRQDIVNRGINYEEELKANQVT